MPAAPDVAGRVRGPIGLPADGALAIKVPGLYARSPDVAGARGCPRMAPWPSRVRGPLGLPADGALAIKGRRGLYARGTGRLGRYGAGPARVPADGALAIKGAGPARVARGTGRSR